MRSIPINAGFKGDTYSTEYIQGTIIILMCQSRLWETIVAITITSHRSNLHFRWTVVVPVPNHQVL